jgi:hypothetical protein
MPSVYPACAHGVFGYRGSAFRDESAMHDDLRRDGDLAEKGFTAAIDPTFRTASFIFVSIQR